MNPDLAKLSPYPFEFLAKLKAEVTPPTDKQPILLSIGEPKHTPPSFVCEEVITHMHSLCRYPSTKGSDELREAIADWLTKRFSLSENSLNAGKNVLPVNGTREALFAFAQCIVDRTKNSAKVLMPNPFYQIYEGAAFLAGAQPYFLNATAETGHQPDFDEVSESVWKDCQLLYLCSPGNPSGTTIEADTFKKLIQLSDKHNFIIASDECYSELYDDESKPPTGLLETAAQMGRNNYKNCIVFHSLSKRSNLPGLRSGFVAGDANIIKKFLLYRTYHGCAMPLHSQAASILAWRDEKHVQKNRDIYRQKFDAVLEILQPVMNIERPPAGFYLWAETAINDTDFAQKLYAQQNVTVLPGRYLSRHAHGLNPGENRIRMALVAPLDECIEAANRIKEFIKSL